MSGPWLKTFLPSFPTHASMATIEALDFTLFTKNETSLRPHCLIQ